MMGAQLSLAAAITIDVPNGNFSSAANNGSISSTLLNPSVSAQLLGSGPWGAQILSSVGSASASIGGGTASFGSTVLYSAAFYQTLSETYQGGQTYTVSVDISTGQALSLNLLGTNGIGVALTAGNASLAANVVASSLSSAQLVSLGGNSYRLSVDYTVPLTPPGGNIGIRLFAGQEATSIGLLNSVAFDNVTLSAVPEPNAVGLALVGFCGLAILGAKRRRLRARALGVVGALALVLPSQAGLLSLDTTNKLIGVTLLPNASYEVNVDVTVTDLTALLDILGDNNNPLKILDDSGAVLGEITGGDLLEGLIGADTLPLVNDLGAVLGFVQVDELIERLLGTDTSALPVLNSAGEVIGSLSGTGLLDGVLGVLGGLLGVNDDLPLIGNLGETLGLVSLDKLIESLTGGTGDLTGTIKMLIETTSSEVIEPVVGVLDTPIIQLGNSTVNPAPVVNNTTVSNRNPTVKITKRQRKGNRLILKGTSADSDGRVTRVEVFNNGKKAKVKGARKWTSRVALRNGRNRIVVRALDNRLAMSPAKRTTVNVR